MKIDAQNLHARILEIQRMSTEDGPGIRSTVFFKGCPLKCDWCHNPESISPHPQVHWIANRCIGCKTCLEICPEAALSDTGQGISIDRSICNGCGRCARECPATALELLGQKWDVAALLNELVKDRTYFETSGGGVTLGGGEPTRQPEFILRLLKELKAQGIHTALDICGLCPPETLARILEYTDLLLFDLKLMDNERHRRFAGSPNTGILENFRQACALWQAGDRPREIWVRTPVIPGRTNDKADIREIGAFIAAQANGAVSRWDLCAFNNLCRDKYLRLGIDWKFKDQDLLPRAEMEQLAEAARNSGVNPAIVHWSGSTRLESG